MTQPLPPRDPSPWPDTFAAGSAVAHDIPLRRSWETVVEEERQTTARRVRAVKVQAAYDDRDVLLRQLPCAASWVMPVPPAKTECSRRTLLFATPFRISR